MMDRRRDAIGRHDDRQALFEPVEIANGDSALDHLQLVLGEQRNNVRGRIHEADVNLDAGFPVIALVLGDIGDDGAEGLHGAELDLLDLRNGGRSEQPRHGGERERDCKA